MCGIAGKARADSGPVEVELIERMCAAIEHRGPDSRGIHVSAGVGLGIQRLRVIDLETGDQPIYNEDGTIAVVLNGEIYNYAELRQTLRQLGHTLSTNGDTETIVHLYEQYGVDCVSKLHGMFAFALWDSRRRRLVLARDRVGKKPLFYSERDGALSFASELSALLKDPDIPHDIDHRALSSYLTYLYIPAPRSAYEAVLKLPPATVLVYEDGAASLQRYWSLDFSRKRPVGNVESLHEEIREAIRTAVRRRLVADVPIGAHLSGGIDSSAIVAAMAQEAGARVKTFSIGFDHESFDELPAARRVAEHFATDHYEFTVRPDAIEVLPKIVRHYGEPFADHSAVPSFYVSALTRDHVTVALNGDGGDESFAGYYSYVYTSMMSRFDRLPIGLRRMAAAAASRLPTNGEDRSTLNRMHRVLGALPLDGPARFSRYMSCFDSIDRERLYTAEYKALLADSDPESLIRDAWGGTSGTSLLDVMLEVDITTWLPGDLIPKMDVATMAHALEARSPFLDHELMQMAASIPAELKLPGTRKKGLLRDALAPWLPADILQRPKQGFCVPMASWLRNDLRGFAAEILLDPLTERRGYFRRSELSRLLERHSQGIADHGNQIWALLVQELWHREFIDGSPQASDASTLATV
jgi:asparagine synthase (glutamine-hydrolysing)